MSIFALTNAEIGIYVHYERSGLLWPISRTDGQSFQLARTMAHVHQTICQGDGTTGCGLHRHRPADQFFYWCCYLHPDKNQHPKSLDASLYYRLHNSRDHGLGVLQQYHVSHSVRKGGVQHTSELGTMRVTQQIDALEIMGVNSASFLILPKIAGMMTTIPFLVVFSIAAGFVGAYATAIAGVITVDDLTLGLLHSFNQWFIWMSIIKSFIFAFIIASVSSFYGYTVEGGSFDVGKSSTDAVVSSSMLILFADIFLTPLLS